MTDTAPTADPKHPLLDDPARLERILDVMWDAIHRVLNWPKPKGTRRTRPSGGVRERALVGTCFGADDVLSEAMTDLLSFPPARLESTWEGLAVTIARRRAIDAIQAANKGLGETTRRERLQLVSGDQPAGGSQREAEVQRSILDLYPDASADPEEEFLALEGLRDLLALAREVLSDRHLFVFQTVHYQQKSRKDLGLELGLSGQRVGQIYTEAIEQLEDHPRYPCREERDDHGGSDEHGH